MLIYGNGRIHPDACMEKPQGYTDFLPAYFVVGQKKSMGISFMGPIVRLNECGHACLEMESWLSCCQCRGVEVDTCYCCPICKER